MTRDRIMMKGIIIINEWSSLNITTAHDRISSKVLANKKVWMTRKFIKILHHGSRTMNDTKIVRKKYWD